VLGSFCCRPDLGSSPAALIDLFNADVSAHVALGLIRQDREQTATLAGAILRHSI
jgi:hypothetical protein